MTALRDFFNDWEYFLNAIEKVSFFTKRYQTVLKSIKSPKRYQRFGTVSASGKSFKSILNMIKGTSYYRKLQRAPKVVQRYSVKAIKTC
jgi:hypothetical protein